MSPLLKYKKRLATTSIILHDSHTPPYIGTAQSVPRWSDLALSGGLKRGLLSIGYHFIIERSGERVACRPHDLIGTHSPGSNLESLGVCLVGGRSENGDPEDNFTLEQRLEVYRLVADMRSIYGSLKVKGHTEVQRYRNAELPQCPYLDMDLLREDIELYAKGYVLT